PTVAYPWTPPRRLAVRSCRRNRAGWKEPMVDQLRNNKNLPLAILVVALGAVAGFFLTEGVADAVAAVVAGALTAGVVAAGARVEAPYSALMKAINAAGRGKTPKRPSSLPEDSVAVFDALENLAEQIEEQKSAPVATGNLDALRAQLDAARTEAESARRD